VEVYSGGSAKVLGIFGGSGMLNVITRWGNSDYVNDRRNYYARQLDEMSARLAGDLPYVTGMRFSATGTVTNVNFGSIEENIGRFTTGFATLLNQRSLLEYVQTLTNAVAVETLLVQRTEVGW